MPICRLQTHDIDPTLRHVSAWIDEKTFKTYRQLLILAVNPLLALTLHKHLHGQLVVKDLH